MKYTIKKICVIPVGPADPEFKVYFTKNNPIWQQNAPYLTFGRRKKKLGGTKSSRWGGGAKSCCKGRKKNRDLKKFETVIVFVVAPKTSTGDGNVTSLQSSPLSFSKPP